MKLTKQKQNHMSISCLYHGYLNLLIRLFVIYHHHYCYYCYCFCYCSCYYYLLFTIYYWLLTITITIAVTISITVTITSITITIVTIYHHHPSWNGQLAKYIHIEIVQNCWEAGICFSAKHVKRGRKKRNCWPIDYLFGRFSSRRKASLVEEHIPNQSPQGLAEHRYM